MKNILITGGTGFVGTHLVEALVNDTSSNIHVTSYKSDETFLNQLLPQTNIHSLDLTDQKATFKLFAKIQPQEIYHLAAIATVGESFSNTQRVLDNNTQLQLNVLESIKQYCPHARVLIIGSAMEYDLQNLNTDKLSSIDENQPLGPTSPYAVSKVIQDLLAYSYFKSYDLNIVRARPFNHIGERQTKNFVIPAFGAQIVAIEQDQQQDMTVGNLDAIRDFTDVKDMVNAYMILIKQGKKGEVYNIGTGQGHSIKEILNLLIGLAKTKIIVKNDPNKIRPADVQVAIANADKIKQLGWQPTITLENTLKRILNYWRTNL